MQGKNRSQLAHSKQQQKKMVLFALTRAAPLVSYMADTEEVLVTQTGSSGMCVWGGCWHCCALSCSAARRLKHGNTYNYGALKITSSPVSIPRAAWITLKKLSYTLFSTCDGQMARSLFHHRPLKDFRNWQLTRFLDCNQNMHLFGSDEVLLRFKRSVLKKGEKFNFFRPQIWMPHLIR